MKLHIVSATTKTAEALRERLLSPWSACLWKAPAFGNKLRFNSKAVCFFEESVNFLRLTCSRGMYGKNQLIVCENCHVSVLLFGKWLRILGIPQRIYLLNFYLHDMGKAAIVKTILAFLLRQDVGIMAYSASDRDYFKKLSPTADVRFTPWCGEDGFDAGDLPIKDGDYIFAGGYANRDYNFFIRCAAAFPKQRFMIVCSKRNRIAGGPPENVEIFNDISPQEFHARMAASKAIVIPLKNDVGASGQMVAVAAMKLGKAILYPDFNGVAHYFEDKVSGLQYKAGNIDSLKNAISFVLENPSVCMKIGAKARQQWQARFRGDQLNKALEQHATEFLGIRLR
jgi:glycosyltransferase involved in cell wall biosynthesis